MPKGNVLGDIIGGIIGIPGKVLEKSGLDQPAEILLDSLNDQGQVSVSSLLDIGGVRTRKKKMRELETSLAELRVENAQQSLANSVITGERSELALGADQRAEALSVQGTSVDEVGRLGVAAQQQGGEAGVAAFRGGERVGNAAQVGIAVEQQARRDLVGTDDLAGAVRDRRSRASSLNEQLVREADLTPAEAQDLTDQLTSAQITDLQTSIATGKFSLRKSLKLADRRNADAARRAARTKSAKEATDFQKKTFEGGVADQIAASVGATMEDKEGDTIKAPRKGGTLGFTRQELAILPTSKEFGRQVLKQTRNSTVAAQAALDNFLLNHPDRARFDLLGAAGKKDSLTTVDKVDFGTGIRDEVFGGEGVGPVDPDAEIELLTNMARNVDRTRSIWNGVQGQVANHNPNDPTAAFIQPFSPAYYMAWQEAINKVPGWTMKIDPKGAVTWEGMPPDLVKQIERLILGQ